MKATAILKSINRNLKKTQAFSGSRTFGIDYNTWAAIYPKTAAVVNVCASQITGRIVTRAVPRGMWG